MKRVERGRRDERGEKLKELDWTLVARRVGTHLQTLRNRKGAEGGKKTENGNKYSTGKESQRGESRK
jgi:hypothetical protein